MTFLSTPRIVRFVAPGALILAVLLAGCKDPSLAERSIPSISVTTVETPYGVTLDENASPQDVAYVFFRAAKDDFQAAQDPKRRAAQQAAFKLQLELAAANAIKAQVDRLYARDALPVKRSRDEAVYQTVRVWTPIVDHYINNFSDDRAAMIRKMHTVTRSQGDAVDVYFRVVREPSRALIKISLERETGDDGKRYWRIVQVGFSDPRRRPTTAPARTRPTASK